MSSVQGLYSTCTAEMGWMAWARRRVVDEISERPRYLTFPSLYGHKSCFMLLSWWNDLLDQLLHGLHSLLNRHILVCTMHVVQINVLNTKPLQTALNTPPHMLRR